MQDDAVAAVVLGVVVVLVQPPSLTSPQGQEPHEAPAPHLRPEVIIRGTLMSDCVCI